MKAAGGAQGHRVASEQAGKTTSPVPSGMHRSEVIQIIQATPEKKDLTDLALYAPALPGVLVALAGVWFGHWLSQKRDRRKEISDACSEIKDLAGMAVDAAISAWTAKVGDKRRSSVKETYRRFNILGIAATSLRDRTDAKPLFRRQKSIDLTSAVFALRKSAMMDPFDDPSRAASSANVDQINTELSALWAEVGRQFLNYKM